MSIETYRELEREKEKGEREGDTEIQKGFANKNQKA